MSYMYTCTYCCLFGWCFFFHVSLLKRHHNDALAIRICSTPINRVQFIDFSYRLNRQRFFSYFSITDPCCRDIWRSSDLIVVFPFTHIFFIIYWLSMLLLSFVLPSNRTENMDNITGFWLDIIFSFYWLLCYVLSLLNWKLHSTVCFVFFII